MPDHKGPCGSDARSMLRSLSSVFGLAWAASPRRRALSSHPHVPYRLFPAEILALVNFAPGKLGNPNQSEKKSY